MNDDWDWDPDDRPWIPKSKLMRGGMSKIAFFLFNKCARGARLFYGLNLFFIGVSTFLLGFKQIYIAITI